ncbi:MAG: hypothetical protein ABR527_08135 [Gemmatimonadota bacterium]
MADYTKTDPQGTRVVSAVFQKAEDAEKAYADAVGRGYTDREITVLMSQQARDRYYPSERVEIEHHTKALSGTGVGSAVGATVGALAGALLALGTVVAIPPLGLIVAGPLAVGLAGAGAGSITGGLVGALVGAGISEDRAKVYHTAIEKGGIVLAVTPHTAEDAEALAEAFDDAGGEEVYRA